MKNFHGGGSVNSSLTPAAAVNSCVDFRFDDKRAAPPHSVRETSEMTTQDIKIDLSNLAAALNTEEMQARLEDDEAVRFLYKGREYVWDGKSESGDVLLVFRAVLLKARQTWTEATENYFRIPCGLREGAAIAERFREATSMFRVLSAPFGETRTVAMADAVIVAHRLGALYTRGIEL